jgi:ATP-dependent helicase/nuclease subunit A
MLDGALGQRVADAESSQSVVLGSGAVAIEVVRESLTAPSQAKAKTAGGKKNPDWRRFIATWARRTAVYEKARQAASFLTPTRLKRQEEARTEAGDRMTKPTRPQTPALIVGDLAHRFLQNWNFSSTADRFEDELHHWIAGALPSEFERRREKIESELQEIFAAFIHSDAYAEIAGARILGREVPLVMPWNGQIMEGVIDLIYERNGLLCLADYKTDRIGRNELNQEAERYRLQAEIYSQAVVQSLHRKPTAFKIIFLRLGEAVELGVSKNQQLALF